MDRPRRYLLYLVAGVLLLASTTASRAEGERIAYLIEQLEYSIDGRTVVRESHTKNMAEALSDLGFTVQRYENLSSAAIEPALQEISNDSKGAEAAILYISGLVLSEGGAGGILPTDLNSADLLDGGISMSRLLDLPKAADLRLVIVDSPEDAHVQLGLSPAAGFSPYLAVPSTIPPNVLGTITGRPPFGGYTGLTLSDRADYFPRSFSRFFKAKGRSMRSVLNKIAISVFYDSQHRLYPHVFGAQDKEYLLVRKNEVSDLTAWLELLGKPSAEGFKSFLKAYPDSLYAEFARKQLDALQK